VFDIIAEFFELFYGRLSLEFVQLFLHNIENTGKQEELSPQTPTIFS
jgi:hypothetical protein